MCVNRDAGFTIIELIVVIIVVGVLSVVAASKYIDLSTKSRIAVVKQLEGSVVSAAEMVRNLALARGYMSAATSVDLGDGLVVSINNKSYPLADATQGIGAAGLDLEDFTAVLVANGIRYDVVNGNPNCSVLYTITIDSSPSITSITNGC